MAKPTDHPALLEAAHRALATSQLAWLRSARVSDDADAALAQLFSDEAWEALEQAGREGRYRAEELPWAAAQIAELARARVLLELRPVLATLLAARAPLGHGAEFLPELVTRLVAPADHEYEPSAVLRAIDAALAPHARRFLELHARAEGEASAQRSAAAKLAPPPPSAAGSQRDGMLEHLAVGAGSSPLTAAAQLEALARADGQGGSPLAAAAQLEALARAGGQSSSSLAAAGRSPATGSALTELLARPDCAARLGLGPSASPAELLAALERLADASAAPPPPSAAARLAEQWLTQTDDAARELTRWLVKRSAGGAATRHDLPQLLAAVRGHEWDGLARPAQRFFRVAAGARGLGFERELSAHMHGELGTPLLVPFARSVALAVPGDVRVAQPGLDYGLLSDVATAQGMGEALALALTSPAAAVAQRRPVGRSVSLAFGGLFAQLRADRGYLMRVDGVDREVAANAARLTGVWLLLSTRLAAAIFNATQASAGSESERLLQLTAASERALGKPLPEGLAALALVLAAPEAGSFAALADGCALHAALRERYDHDFYRNPRVSAVVRGAAARGNALDAAGWIDELGGSPEAGIARMLELVG